VAPCPIQPGQVHGRGEEELAKEPGSVRKITNPSELDQAFMNYFPLGSIEHGEERQREWYGQGLALESLYNILTMRYYSSAAFHKALCRTDGDYLELRGEDQFWSQNRGDRGLIGCNYYGIVLMCVREENQYADPRGLPTEDNSIPRGLRREPEVWRNTPEAATFISALGQKRLSSGSFYQIPEIPPPPFGMKYVILHRRVVLVDDNEDPAQLDGEPHDNNQGKTPGYPGPHVPRSKGIPLPSTGNPNPVVTLTTGGGVQEPASGNLMAPARSGQAGTNIPSPGRRLSLIGRKPPQDPTGTDDQERRHQLGTLLHRRGGRLGAASGTPRLLLQGT
jgi:hypothetical protein